MWLFLMWATVLVAALYLYLRQAFSFYDKRGVKTEKSIPLLGTMVRILFRRKHFVYNSVRTYTSFPEERFVGQYEFMEPVIFLRDLELIKKVTIKDFEHFLDRRAVVFGKDSDPLFGRNLLSLTGQEWKDMRSTLSPAFTSSKMRLMVPFMVEVGDNMVANIKKQIKDSENDYLDVEVKDLTTRNANDIIASCAFGLKVDSQTDRDNQFYTQGLIISAFKLKQILIFVAMNSFPMLMKLIPISLIPRVTSKFFRNLVLDTMKDRENRNIIRPDMIHLLMEAKKGTLTHDDKTTDPDAGFATVEESSVGKKNVNKVWTNDDLIAQAVIFFIAGFETISSAMVFLLYELAVNPDVQEKLVQEIRDTDARNGGKFDYTTIQEMTYMDMVVSETLRKWPPITAVDRLCIKDYNLGKPNDKSKEDYIMRKGEGLSISTWALHRSPEYFPNPEKFDPERFSEENKHKIVPLSFIPFGAGPRNCIGSRFALCEVKVMTYQLLRHLELSPGPKTCIPAKLDRNSANLRLEGGHWLRFRLRR